MGAFRTISVRSGPSDSTTRVSPGSAPSSQRARQSSPSTRIRPSGRQVSTTVPVAPGSASAPVVARRRREYQMTTPTSASSTTAAATTTMSPHGAGSQKTATRIASRRSMPGAGVEPARPQGGHLILSQARMTSFATPAGARIASDLGTSRLHVVLAEAALLDVVLARLRAFEAERVDELVRQVLVEGFPAGDVRPGDQGDLVAELRVLGDDQPIRVLVVERVDLVDRALRDLRPEIDDHGAVLEVVDSVQLGDFFRVGAVDDRLVGVWAARARYRVRFEVGRQSRDVRTTLGRRMCVRVPGRAELPDSVVGASPASAASEGEPGADDPGNHDCGRR